MTLLRVPAVLHDVFGERQRPLALVLIGAAALGVPVALAVAEPHLMTGVPLWRIVLSALLLADIAAGAVANLTSGTNDHYATRPTARWVFLAAHLHLPVVALLLDLPLVAALILWAATISGGMIINLLRLHPEQRAIAGTFFVGILTASVLLTDARALTVVGSLFAFKVCYAFAVDHDPSGGEGQSQNRRAEADQRASDALT